MKRARLAFAIIMATSVAGAGWCAGRQPQNQYTLVWSDEFDGPNGSRPDLSKWTYDTGGNGWGNGELETYTNRIQNSHIQGGNLAIQAIEESFTGADGIPRRYTSARLKTQGLFRHAYGRVEARIKLPYGQGIWPAFWMMGDDLPSVGWPQCGEIDIMENIGSETSTIHGTVHGPGYSGIDGVSALYTLPNGQRFSDDFHIFKVEWEPHTLRFFVDDQLYKTITKADLPTGATWVYDHPFFILLNLAVGGDWPGSPNSTTVFPQTMLVDYVRVYEKRFDRR